MLDFLSSHHPVGQYTGYRTHVIARYFYAVNSLDDTSRLHEIFSAAKKHNIALLVIGGGTNLLFASRMFRGVIIKNNLSGREYDSAKKILTVFSNELISSVAEWLEYEHHQPLWHRFIGLPGTIAGAVVGNAGCFGLETASNFLDATAYNMQTGETKTFSKEEMQFAYRHSYFKDHPEYFIISARFDLSEKREKYASRVDNIDFRENKQPKGNSCGSFFKNPTHFPLGSQPSLDTRPPSAGMLIEQVGLKGYRIGGAYWSPLHANFLLADAGCTPEDLMSLVRMTQDRVQKETGFTLINEVRIIDDEPQKSDAMGDISP